MIDILDDLRAVQKLQGDTYSSYEVLGMVGRAADEIERLRSVLKMVVTDLGEGVDPQEIRACVLDVLNYEIIRERSPVTRSDNPEPEITAGNGLITGRLRAND